MVPVSFLGVGNITQVTIGAKASVLPNLDLGWEKTASTNIGVDFGFLNNRISEMCIRDSGNSFLEKAPGGSVTKDTVFNNAEYTKQFLTNLYGCLLYTS